MKSPLIINNPKENCCGCGACVQICPRHCIEMVRDTEGFLYPKLRKEECTGCLKCESVCPWHGNTSERLPLCDYGIINENEEIREQSSSGGVFYVLAKKIIENDGVVFGACFDENNMVRHDLSEDLEGILKFLGSKYVQSEIGSVYSQVKEYLLNGRYVLFSGTPCQVLGLKNYLKKDYEKLLTIDCICHGVPSPLVWEKYLSEIVDTSKKIKVVFRDKSEGWYGYHVCIRSVDGGILYKQKWTSDPYMQLFVSDYSLRPSCYNCPAKVGKSGSDITLGDFWGVDKTLPDMYDNKGTSLVLANTQKGKLFIQGIEGLKSKVVPHESSIIYNPAWSNKAQKPSERDYFFRLIQKKNIWSLYVRFLHPEMLVKNVIKGKIALLLHKFRLGKG